MKNDIGKTYRLAVIASLLALFAGSVYNHFSQEGGAVRYSSDVAAIPATDADINRVIEVVRTHKGTAVQYATPQNSYNVILPGLTCEPSQLSGGLSADAGYHSLPASCFVAGSTQRDKIGENL
jgi:hypothetical protein